MVALNWQQTVGNQRDWVWRGWQTRYIYMRPRSQQVPCASAQPFLLLHGFGASVGHWRHTLEGLGLQHAVYAFDLLGFGASEKGASNYAVAFWVEQVYAFWQTFIGQPVVLVGNSTGSLVSVAAAALHPEMVAGIVALNLPDPALREEAIPGFLRPAIACIESIFASPLLLKPLFYWVRQPNIVRSWAKIAYANPDAVTDELVEILSQPAYDRDAAQAFCRILKAMTQPRFAPSVKGILPQLSIPILLIWGKQDRMVPPKFAPQFASCNPNMTVVELENAGHCPHDECPEQVNQLILDWIETWTDG